MLKWTKLKPVDSWNLITLETFEQVDEQMSRLSVVSELDFKGRLVYQELESLFRRPFEIELLDNLEILQQLLGVKDPNKLEPQILA